LANRESLIEESTPSLNAEKMEESTVEIHGNPQYTHNVKIIDKSKRAYSFSLDSTKAFELSLQKPRNECKHKCTRFRATLYAMWILFFKHHGKPPGKQGLYTFFLVYSALLSIDLVLLIAFMLHLLSPIDKLETIGWGFLALYPGLTLIAPISGCIACITGDAKFMKWHSGLNAACVAMNYPLTLLVQISVNDGAPYIAIILLLILNKVGLSYFGAKVRLHLENPGFAKTQAKLEQRFENFVYTKPAANGAKINFEDDDGDFA